MIPELETQSSISIICFTSVCMEFSLNTQNDPFAIHAFWFGPLLFGMFEMLPVILFIFFKECKTKCLPYHFKLDRKFHMISEKKKKKKDCVVLRLLRHFT